MQQPKNLNRLLRALSRQGLDVSYENKVYSICLNSSLKEQWQDADAPTAEVLLPEDFPVEAKALKQLANLANVRHPQGGCVCRAIATPDFYPGDAGVAKGSMVSRSRNGDSGGHQFRFMIHRKTREKPLALDMGRKRE
jgi:tRNA-splicing ligase RtcB